MSPVA